MESVGLESFPGFLCVKLSYFEGKMDTQGNIEIIWLYIGKGAYDRVV